MNVYIKLLVAGTDVGPFDLYSDVGGFVSTFETGVTRTSLVDGYTATDVPEGTTQIKIQSTGNCTNYIIVDIEVVTTSTTTTIYSTTSTTTTVISTTTTTATPTTAAPQYYKITECHTEDDGKIMAKNATNYQVNDLVRFSHIPDDGRIFCGTVTNIHWLTGPANVLITGSPPSSCSDGCYGEN